MELINSLFTRGTLLLYSLCVSYFCANILLQKKKKNTEYIEYLQ